MLSRHLFVFVLLGQPVFPGWLSSIAAVVHAETIGFVVWHVDPVSA